MDFQSPVMTHLDKTSGSRKMVCPRSDTGELIQLIAEPRSLHSHVQYFFVYNANTIWLSWFSKLYLKNYVSSAFQGGQTGSMGPPAVTPSFRPEDELEHLTKKMLYDMENPPAEEYFGEWGLALTSKEMPAVFPRY